MSLSELKERLLGDLPTELKKEFEFKYDKASDELEKTRILKEYNMKFLKHHLQKKKLPEGKVDQNIKVLLQERLKYELNVMDYQLKLNPNSTRVIQSTVDGYNFIGARRRATSTTRKPRKTKAVKKKTQRALVQGVKEQEESICDDNGDKAACLRKIQDAGVRVEELLKPKTLKILYEITDGEGELMKTYESILSDINTAKLSFRNKEFKLALLEKLDIRQQKSDLSLEDVKDFMEEIKNDLVAKETSMICKISHIFLDIFYVISIGVNCILRNLRPIDWIKFVLGLLIPLFTSFVIEKMKIVSNPLWMQTHVLDAISHLITTASQEFMNILKDSLATSLSPLGGVSYLIGEIDQLIHSLSGHSLYLGQSEIQDRNFFSVGIFANGFGGNLTEKLYYFGKFTAVTTFTTMMTMFLPWAIDKLRDFMKTWGCFNTSLGYNFKYFNKKVRDYLAKQDYQRAFEYIKSNFPDLSFPQKSHSIKATASGWAF